MRVRAVLINVMFFGLSLLMVRCAGSEDIDKLQSQVDDLKKEVSDVSNVFDKTYDISPSDWKPKDSKVSENDKFSYEISVAEFTEKSLQQMDIHLQGFVYDPKGGLSYAFSLPYEDVGSEEIVKHAFYVKTGKVILEQFIYDLNSKPKKKSKASTSLTKVRVFVPRK